MFNQKVKADKNHRLSLTKPLSSTDLNDNTRHQRQEQFNHHLLSSEDQYVHELETLVLYVFEPLKKNASRCKIPPKEVEKVYAYLDSMLKFHASFLSVITDTISVLPDMYKYQSFVKMYADYLRDYDDIIHTFSSWHSMECREFLTLRLKQNEVQKHIDQRLCSLPWYLYRPFDRIKEYYRFLRDLHKLSAKSDDDYKMLVSTLEKMKIIYKRIKKNETRLQMKTRLLEVQLQMHGNPEPLVCDDRKFLYNRMCQMKRNILWKKYKQVTIYLFTDLFLWVSSRGRYKGSYSFYKPNLVIAKPSDCKPGEAQFVIGLSSEKTKRLIVCADDIQRDKLMSYIQNAYYACQQSLQNAPMAKKLEIQERMARAEGETRDFSRGSSMTDQSYEPSYSFSHQSMASDISSYNNGGNNNNNSNHSTHHNNNNSNHNLNNLGNAQSLTSAQSLNSSRSLPPGLTKISETRAVDEELPPLERKFTPQNTSATVADNDSNNSNNSNNSDHHRQKRIHPPPQQQQQQQQQPRNHRMRVHAARNDHSNGSSGSNSNANSNTVSQRNSFLAVDQPSPTPDSNNITPVSSDHDVYSHAMGDRDNHENDHSGSQNHLPINMDSVSAALLKETSNNSRKSVPASPTHSAHKSSNLKIRKNKSKPPKPPKPPKLIVIAVANGYSHSRGSSHHSKNSVQKKHQSHTVDTALANDGANQLIAKLRAEIQALKENLVSKDHEISVLEVSNASLRKTLKLNDNRIVLLQTASDAFKPHKKRSHRRPKSMMAVPKYATNNHSKKGSRFKIGKNGKIERSQVFLNLNARNPDRTRATKSNSPDTETEST